MKKIILMASLVLFAVSLEGMDRTDEYSGDRLPDEYNIATAESNKNLPEKLLVPFDTFKKGEKVLAQKTMTFEWQTQNGSFMIVVPDWLRYEMQSKLPSGKFKKSNKGSLISLDITLPTVGLPSPVKCPKGVSVAGWKELSPMCLTIEVLASLYQGSEKQAVALVELLNGDKRAIFVKNLQEFLPEDLYNNIKNQGAWAQVFKLAESLVNDGKEIVDNLKKEAKKNADGWIIIGKNYLQKNWTPMVLGSFITALGMYFAFLRNR